MKFVIKSLLFVHLLLQMTNALRKCFEHDQNIMITIILLAFSVIGLLGLFIGNRFILIIFSASMTLILIASITIYAISRTDQDSMRPKVPYYTNVPIDQLDDAVSKRLGMPESENRLKSIVGKWFNKQQRDGSTTTTKNRSRLNRTRLQSNQAQRGENNKLRQITKKSPILAATPMHMLNPELLDDLSDDPTNPIRPTDAATDSHDDGIDSRSFLKQISGGSRDRIYTPIVNEDSIDADRNKQSKSEMSSHTIDQSKDREHDRVDFTQVESDQWVAYERYLYEKYLHIVSQSIDLVLLTILSAWMALLLDDDSDHCFNSKNNSRRKVGQTTISAKEAPVYNYNGVRYSIKSDLPESPTRVVIH